MDDKEFEEALDLHAKTHHLKRQVACAVGHSNINARCAHISALAEAGLVAAPLWGRPGESHTPDLYQAAADRGKLVDESGASVPYVPLPPYIPPPFAGDLD